MATEPTSPITVKSLPLSTRIGLNQLAKERDCTLAALLTEMVDNAAHQSVLAPQDARRDAQDAPPKLLTIEEPMPLPASHLHHLLQLAELAGNSKVLPVRIKKQVFGLVYDQLREARGMPGRMPRHPDIEAAAE